MQSTSRRCGLGLLSGGLDSQLAVCVLREQGIDVQGVVFNSPFFDIGSARRAAAALAIPLHVVDFTSDILELIEEPKHGFGKCMNPCVDCHARMLKRAGEMMVDVGAHFLFTGEVLNERPKSQSRRSLEIVARESGFADWILRPLSAGYLPATLPERNGWVDRERLPKLQGRSRKPQFALAEKHGLEDYPTPAGGCRLTEPNFARRLKDLKDHEGLSGKRALHLLRVGRHFRVGERTKLIVGRNEQENAVIEGNAELYDLVLKLDGISGPVGLLPFTAREDEVLKAAGICARYSSCDPDRPVAVRVRCPRGSRLVDTMPAKPEWTDAIRV